MKYKCLLDYRGKTKAKLTPKHISPCLRAENHGNPGLIVEGKMIIDDTQGFDGVRYYEDYSPTLRAQRSGLKTFGGNGLKTLKVNDLFCGAGGMGLGFKNAGFQIAGAWDFDKYAVQSYKHNVGDHVKEADVLGMTHNDMPYADVWTFGAPCQAFSVAGKQLGMTFKCPNCKHEETFEGELIIDRITFCSECGTLSKPKDIRGIMFFEVMRLLKATEEKPPVIMLENVKGVSKFLDVIAYEYEKRGYRMQYVLYNSKFWGVPQNRERYFVVGVHESIEKVFEFPIQQEYYIPRLSTVLEEEVDEKFYISEDKTKVILNKFNSLKDDAHSVPLKFLNRNQNELPNYAMCADCSQTNGVAIKVREATKKGYAEATIGDSVNISHPNSKTRRGRVGKQVAQTLLTGQEQVVVEETKIINVGNTNPSGNGMNGNVIHEDGISTTLTTNKGEGHKVLRSDFRIRKLTPREYARLQSFPESYELVVSNSQAYKQFGNAVTVNVAQAIAERIRMFLLSL